MLVRFPHGTSAVAIRPYDRPYTDPIAVRAGDAVRPDPARSASTDILGWCWCRADDGREGWVPEAWLDAESRLLRDFSALELSVQTGDRVTVKIAESGFVLCRKSDGTHGWLPDGVLGLDDDDPWAGKRVPIARG